jgi:hypothetical protein
LLFAVHDRNKQHVLRILQLNAAELGACVCVKHRDSVIIRHKKTPAITIHRYSVRASAREAVLA